MDFPPYLLTLLTGWLCGFAFVGFTLGMARKPWGVALHVLGALVTGALLSWVTFADSSVLKDLPGTARSLLLFVQLGAIPGVAWIWLALLGRVTVLASKPAKGAKPPRITPGWEATRKGTQVRFSAIPMPMRTFTVIIAAVVLVVGALVVILLSTVDWFLKTGSAQVIILVVGVVFALPAYTLFRSIVGRTTIPCSISFNEDCLRVEAGHEASVVPYSELERLIWRCDSDYARVEVQGGGHDISLIVGVARMPNSVLPQLPPLSQRTLARLAQAGFEVQRTRRPGLTVLAATA